MVYVINKKGTPLMPTSRHRSSKPRLPKTKTLHIPQLKQGVLQREKDKITDPSKFSNCIMAP